MQISGEFNNQYDFQNDKNSSDPKPPFKIRQGTIKQDFEKLHKNGSSLLKIDDKYIIFAGLLELTERACCHMELKNPTTRTVLFNIRSPASPCFHVKPHVGMLEANKSVTLYFTFKARCHRTPSDYCWIYSIYQVPIDEKSTSWIKEDEFSSSNLRTVWNERGRGNITNILYLSCKFDEEMKPKHECRRHKGQRELFLNDTGEVLNDGNPEESKGENSDTPTAASRRPRSKLNKTPSSETMDELPKTANSEKEKKK